MEIEYVEINKVTAEPMTLGEFINQFGPHDDFDQDHSSPGYAVKQFYGYGPHRGGDLFWMHEHMFEERFFRSEYEASELEEMSIPELAVILKKAKVDLETCGKLKTAVQKMYDYLSIDVIPERMDEEGIVTMKVEGAGRLQASSDIRCNIPAAKKKDAEKWLEENGHGALIGSTINASSLKAFIKERIKEDKPYPEDIFSVLPYSRATVVKV